MRNSYGITAVSAVIVLSAACGSEPENNEILIPNYQLTITGTYGVEIGDSLSMIGSIDDFCCHPDGSILVLDQTAMCVRRFNNGETTLISRTGSGPGEFILPTAICCLSNGIILVADEHRREVMQFSSTGEYLGAFFTTDRYAPHVMYPADSTSFTGSLYDLQFDETRAIFTVNLGKFESSIVPVLVYASRQFEIPDPDAYTQLFKMDYTGAPDGTFYLTMDNTEYSISIYSSAGELTASINCTDVPKIPKTEEEIAEEITEFERYAVNDQSYGGGYEPSPYHQLVSLAGVDANGNLWVERHDTDEGYFFDVWDSTGNLVHTASFQEPESNFEIVFHIDRYGILAAVTDPDQFPQVFSLELAEQEQSQE